MNGADPVRQLRERLLQARRGNDRAALPELIDGLQSLAATRHRCCLVDFDRCRPQYYVRLLGCEGPRITAQLEFPIDPRLHPVQRVPLSHLVEYEEAEPGRIRSIYESMAPFVRDRRLPLARQVPCAPRQDAPPPPARRRRPGRGTDLWWGVASLLLVTSLLLLAAA